MPIPPVLVELLRHHIKVHGIASDGRLFRGSPGGPLADSVYLPVWAEARKQKLTPEQFASPMARRPYDLRHGASSLWLNSGVPATEVARRLGHSVDVLLRVYAHCVDGEEGTANGRITGALGYYPISMINSAERGCFL